mgnify:CR=1 FL=1
MAGARLSEAGKLESAMLDYLKSLPAANGKRPAPESVKIDGSLAAHKASLAQLPDPLRAFLGDGDAYFLVRGEYFFLAAGAEAVERLRECIKLQPRDGPVLRMEATPSMLDLLILAKSGDDGVKQWGKLFRKGEKIQILGARVEGGAVLRVRYATDLPSLLKLVDFFGR